MQKNLELSSSMFKQMSQAIFQCYTQLCQAMSQDNEEKGPHRVNKKNDTVIGFPIKSRAEAHIWKQDYS